MRNPVSANLCPLSVRKNAGVPKSFVGCHRCFRLRSCDYLRGRAWGTDKMGANADLLNLAVAAVALIVSVVALGFSIFFWYRQFRPIVTAMVETHHGGNDGSHTTWSSLTPDRSRRRISSSSLAIRQPWRRRLAPEQMKRTRACGWLVSNLRA